MKEIVEEIVASIEGGRPAALVTPVATAGSIPTGRQARMLVFADGSIAGTVGGGRMEGEARETALAVIEEGKARLIHFALTAQAGLEDGLLCGGQATFFVEPLSSGQGACFSRLRQLLEGGEPGMEAVLLSEGEEVGRLVACADGERVGTLGERELDEAVLEQLEEVIEEDCARVEEVECGGKEIQVFVQALQPRPTVFLFGGGHVGLALTRLVPTAGMRLVVVDDRAEFCSRERFPMADEVHVREFGSALEGLDIGSLGYVVVMTRGHKWDREVVAQALRTQAGYIGMIGSRRKIGLTWETMKEEGFTDADLERVRAPIGLDIGGDTPGEIAISIMAELIQVRRRGGGA